MPSDALWTMDLSMLKISVILSIIFFSSLSIAQDPATTLKIFDSKIYSLKNKGVKDLSFDISSTKLTQEMNTQGTFGTVKNLFFRVFWTLNPERLDIEVVGLPDGFKEVKEELKLSVLGLLENVLPPPTDKKFASYKFTSIGRNQFQATDTTGVADIPTFIFKFDDQVKLLEITGQKPVGSVKVTPSYEKEPYSEGRWVLKRHATLVQENGQDVTTTKLFSYGSHEGMTVLKAVNITTEQKFTNRSTVKPVTVSELIEFKNYRINNGDAMRHFIKDIPVSQ